MRYHHTRNGVPLCQRPVPEGDELVDLATRPKPSTNRHLDCRDCLERRETEIRNMRRDGKTLREIGNVFGVSDVAIWFVIHGRGTKRPMTNGDLGVAM